MRKILLSVLVGLSCLTSFAQTAPKVGTVYETIRPVYPGNADEFTVTLDPADSAKSVAVNTYYVTGGLALSAYQPVVTRAGRVVTVRFPNVSVLPIQARVKLKLGDAIKQVWRYDVSESNTIKTAPDNLTISNNVIAGTDSFSALKGVPNYLSADTITRKANRFELNARLNYVTSSGLFISATSDVVQFDNASWVRKSGTITSSTPGYGAMLFAGPSGYYYERKFKGEVWLSWFGASPNNANNSPALQSAINFCASTNRHTIGFESDGRYTFADPVLITTRDIQFKGAAKGRNGRSSQTATELYYTGTGTFISLGSDNGLSYETNLYDGVAPGFKMTDMQLTAATNTTLAGGYGSYATGTTAIADWRGGDVVLEHVQMESFEYGFYGVQSDVNNMNDVILFYCKNGLYLGPRSDQNTINGLYALFCDKAIVLDGNTGTRINNTQIVGSGTLTGPMVEILAGTTNVIFDKGWYENFQTGAGIKRSVFRIGEPGYLGATTTPKSIYILKSTVMTGDVGAQVHVNYFADITQGINIEIDGVDASKGIGVGTDYLVTNKSGISYSVSTFRVRAKNINMADSRIYLNNASGGDFFYEVVGAPDGGIKFTSNRIRLALSGYGFTTGADKFYIQGDNTPGKLILSAPNYTSGPTVRFATNRSIQFASSIPTSGTAQQGDIYWNQAPASYNSPIGWQCTASGSPGVWQPMGYTNTQYDSTSVKIRGGSISGSTSLSVTSPIYTAGTITMRGRPLTLGSTGSSGFTYYARGSDGSLTGYTGYSSATESDDFVIASTTGGGKVGIQAGSNRIGQFSGSGLLLQAGGTFTKNSRDVLEVNGSMTAKFATGTAAPTTAQLPDGYMILWKETTGGTIKWYVNDGGTIKAGAAFN